MAAYAAIVPFKRDLWMRIHYGEVVCEAQVVGKMISAYKELESFQDFLERLDSKMREKMSASLRQVADAIRISRKEEDDLDLLMEILKLVRELFHKHYLLEDDKESGATSRSRVVSKSKRVGLSDFWIQLKEELLAPFSRESVFHTLSLVGMPGIGKTSLAREIFEDLDVIEWFDCRVWLTVGVEWKWLEITQSILAQVECPEIHKGGEEIDILLKECLKDKRFLIVLDDVWNGMAHDYLKICLPDTKNGSQILLTTRSKIVAGPISLEVRLLNEEESWLLLRDRAFNGQMWPSQLEKVGKKIAKKCDGLPLTIVTVADLLSKAEESLWIDVATKKKHQIFTEAYDKISEVQYPSYEYLNIQDKACFLYMGLFPLKSNISGSKLINLWIAEDMIQLEGDRNLELIGALTIFFLKSQSLVMVHQISSGLLSSKPFHGIKTCGLHSSWWHFCQKEARKINFFHVLDCFDDAFEEGIQSQGWLSIHNNVLLALKDVHHSIEENCASTAVTLLCFGPYNQYMVPMCFGLKFLERLDALNIRFYDFPLEILELIELRYLSLTCNGVLPSSISNL